MSAQPAESIPPRVVIRRKPQRVTAVLPMGGCREFGDMLKAVQRGPVLVIVERQP